MNAWTVGYTGVSKVIAGRWFRKETGSSASRTDGAGLIYGEGFPWTLDEVGKVFGQVKAGFGHEITQAAEQLLAEQLLVFVDGVKRFADARIGVFAVPGVFEEEGRVVDAGAQVGHPAEGTSIKPASLRAVPKTPWHKPAPSMEEPRSTAAMPIGLV